MINRQSLWAVFVLVVLAAPMSAQAYSYAAAGKEPLIDGREALLAAVNKEDWVAAKLAFETMHDEIKYLDEHHASGLLEQMTEQLEAKSATGVGEAIVKAFVAEIERRLSAAAKSLKDYQTAKVLVVKSHRLFQATAGEFSPQRRADAEQALKAALEAIGNPGVFGVGRKPADPEAYQEAYESVLKAIAK